MDHTALIPVADAIPVHWFFLHLFLTLTTFLHLVVMNILLGTGSIALLTPCRDGDDGVSLCRNISKKLPILLAFTVNLGVAPLLFLQVLYGQFFYTSSVLMAVFWLSIVGLLIVAYYSAYIYSFHFYKLGAARTVVLGIPMLLCFVVFFFFTNNISIMQLPETWTAYFDKSHSLLLNFSDQSLIARYLHFGVSALAIGGLAIAVYYTLLQRRGDDFGIRWIKYGCDWFSYATLVNFGVGFYFLGTLPEFVRDASTLHGILFTIALYGSIVGTVISLINARLYKVMPAAGWALATVFMMVLARDFVRLAYLRPYFSLSDLPVDPQYSPFLLFLITAVGMGYLVWWMLRKVWSIKEVKS